MKIFDGKYGSKIAKVTVTLDVWIGDENGIVLDTPEKVMESLEGESRKNLGEKVMNNLETAVVVKASTCSRDMGCNCCECNNGVV